jgi:cob(I)alamin adenosyltransferase
VDHRSRLRLPLIASEDVAALEADIDGLEAGLPALTSFVLPAGTPAAAALHHARTVCRRAERAVIAAQSQAEPRPEVIIYLNRLSDLLFVMARHQNRVGGVPDVAWAPRVTAAPKQP